MTDVLSDASELTVTTTRGKSAGRKEKAAPSAPAAVEASRYLEGRWAWFDIRTLDERPGHAELIEAVGRLELSGVVADEAQLDRVPAGVRKVKVVEGTPSDDALGDLAAKYDVLLLEASVIDSNWFVERRERIGALVGARVDVVDPPSLQLAVRMTNLVPLLLVSFKDDTKIPLEIVLADAQNAGTEVVMKVRDSVEANVVFGVLEIGSQGVLLDAEDLAGVYAVDEVVQAAGRKHAQALQKLTVLETKHVGMGDRACLDFTSYMGLDEGVLLGCFSNGGILATSETHPLPYMPTRPFRVNAGALQMYVLAPDNQTWYLSDLRAGMEVLAVKTDGTARPVTVGRVKIERRPMLQIIARAEDGSIVQTIMQEDWHVRVFGTDGKPRNITELRPGDQLFGYTTPAGRHVGVKVDELIIEQ